jgi:hypothetical protein
MSQGKPGRDQLGPCCLRIFSVRFGLKQLWMTRWAPVRLPCSLTPFVPHYGTRGNTFTQGA